MTPSRPSAVQGLTHPNRMLHAATYLWKRRGPMSAAMKSNWCERFFVLTDEAIFWFDKSPPHEKMGSQQGRIELRHILSIQPLNSSGTPATTVDELRANGPSHTLEISSVSSEAKLHIGGTDAALLAGWHDALTRAVARRATKGIGAIANADGGAGAAPSEQLLRLDLAGVQAIGQMQKAREAVMGKAKEMAGASRWSNRLIVLTETHLIFYKRHKEVEHDDDGGGGPTSPGGPQGGGPGGGVLAGNATGFGGIGSSLRTGDYIFGREHGRMALGNAGVESEVVEDSSGKVYTQITLSSSTDSMLAKGMSKLSRAVERGSDRYRATLRTADKAVAAEWLAVLGAACGRQRDAGMEKLYAAISSGDAAEARRLAAELAVASAALPGARRSMRSDHLLGVERSQAFVEVPARPYQRSASYSGGTASQSQSDVSEDEVQEVEVVLRPPRASVTALTASLEQTSAMLEQQTAALLGARGALEALARQIVSDPPAAAAAASTAAAAATAALASCTRDAATPPPSIRSPPLGPTSPRSSPAVGASKSVPPKAELPPPPEAEEADNFDKSASFHRAMSWSTDEEESVATLGGAGGAEGSPEAAAPAPSAAVSTPPVVGAPSDWVCEPGKIKCGSTTREAYGQPSDGDGTEYKLREVGYKKTGKKTPSAPHIYTPLSIDVFKQKSIRWRCATSLSLPPAPGDDSTPNTSGMPRRIVLNTILPDQAPSLMGGNYDGSCYQVVAVLGATTEKLNEWAAEGSNAAKLWQKFCAEAPDGMLPTSGNIDIKERLKLLVRMDNMKKLGLGWVEKYNGEGQPKPRHALSPPPHHPSGLLAATPLPSPPFPRRSAAPPRRAPSQASRR